MKRTILPVLTLSLMVTSCAELGIENPLEGGKVTTYQPVTINAQNTGKGCETLQVAVNGKEEVLAFSPELPTNKVWQVTLPASTEHNLISLKVTCVKKSAEGETTTGYSLSTHTLKASSAELYLAIRDLVKDQKQNLNLRQEYLNPVPFVSPIDTPVIQKPSCGTGCTTPDPTTPDPTNPDPTTPEGGLPRDPNITGLTVNGKINANLGFVTVLSENLKTPLGYGVVNNQAVQVRLLSALPDSNLNKTLEGQFKALTTVPCDKGEVTANTLKFTGTFSSHKAPAYLLPDIKLGGSVHKADFAFVYASGPASLQGEWVCTKLLTVGNQTITHTQTIKANVTFVKGWNVLEQKAVEDPTQPVVELKGQAAAASNFTLSKP